jgi:hypothetical protein
MQESIKNAFRALLLNDHLSTLKKQDDVFATLCDQLEQHDALIKQINLEEEAKNDYALISLYFFLRYLNQHHATTLHSVVTKEYLRLS